MTIETGMHYPLRLDELPSRWRVGYVGDFTKTIEPGFASGEHNAQGTGVPHLRPMNVNRDGQLDFDVVKYVAKEKDKRRLAIGDVLFNNTNSPELVGKTAVVNKAGDFAFSNHMTRITFGDDVLPKFGAIQLHFLWMRGYFRYNCVKHVNQASVSSKTLAGAVPFVWAPLAEQERIVAEIEKQFSRLDEAVANVKRVKANLKRYKAAVLKAAVEGRLVPTEAELARREGRSYETGAQLLQRILESRRSQWKGKGQCKEPVAPDSDNRPDLPNGWQWTSVDQLAQVGTGATPNRGRADYYDGGTVPWVTSAVVNERYVDQPSEFVTTKALAETNLTLYPVGTLIVAMYGEGKTRGKCAELRIAATTNQALAALRVDPHVCDYLRMFLEHNYEETRKVASGGVQPNLNLSLVRSIAIPLPPPVEQHRIVAEVDRRLSLVRGVEAEVDTNLTRAERLRQAVLTRTFA